MTTQNQIDELFSMLGIAQSLIANFPMSIFDSSGKHYDSAIELILDILSEMGYSMNDIVDVIIDTLFETKDVRKLYESGITIDIEDSPFIEKLENGLKIILADMMTAILSCSVDPKIPTSYNTDGIYVPSNAIDLFQQLYINPTSKAGRCYYDVESSMTSIDMYKTIDFNAFMWYTINKSSKDTQRERNKTVWDTRNYARLQGRRDLVRSTNKDWDYWLENLKHEKDPNKLVLKPIVMLEKFDYFDYDGFTLKVPKEYVPSEKPIQTFNYTLYKFNNDYLRSIKIFSGKKIYTAIIDSIMGGALTSLKSLNIDMTKQKVYYVIKKAIKTSIENDDMEVNDCHFTFDNNEWNIMSSEVEAKKFGAVNISYNKNGIVINKDGVITSLVDDINSFNNSEPTDESKTLKYISNEITDAESQKNPEIYYNIDFGLNSNILNALMLSIITPFVECTLSPQVMLFILFNFQIMGLIDIKNLTINEVMEIVLKKMMQFISQLIVFIKDLIIQLLVEKLAMPKLLTLLERFMAKILTEKVLEWIRLLEQSLSCIRDFGSLIFNLINKNTLSSIDDVNYADITTTVAIPISQTGTCDI